MANEKTIKQEIDYWKKRAEKAEEECNKWMKLCLQGEAVRQNLLYKIALGIL